MIADEFIQNLYYTSTDIFPSHASIGYIYSSRLPITTEILQSEAKSDSDYQLVKAQLSIGIEFTDKTLRKYSDRLHIEGNLVYLDLKRALIPRKLRQATLRVLHGGHGGLSLMTLAAAQSVFWPGLTADIIAVRYGCTECARISPSQAQLPG